MPVNLPSWEDCDKAVQAGTASPLEGFICAWEPTGNPVLQRLHGADIVLGADEIFRTQLAAIFDLSVEIEAAREEANESGKQSPNSYGAGHDAGYLAGLEAAIEAILDFRPQEP